MGGGWVGRCGEGVALLLILQDCNTEVQSSREPGGGWEGGGDVMAKDDSDMEGWEDDGWGTFDSTPQQDIASPKSQPQPQKISSGKDFFDSLGASDSKRTKPKDPFEEFGLSSARSPAKKEQTPPLLTSASLFGNDRGGKSAAADKHVSKTAEVGADDNGGWGDWDDSFDTKPASKVCVFSLALCTRPLIAHGRLQGTITAVFSLIGREKCKWWRDETRGQASKFEFNNVCHKIKSCDFKCSGV